MAKDHKDLYLKINLINEIDNNNSELNDLKNTILKFLFAFNVFESEFFEEPKYYTGREAKKTVWDREYEIQTLCNENDYSLELVKKLQEHFLTVYFKNGQETGRFKTLKNKKNIRNFLMNPEENKDNAIETALSIAYNFRNNFFHGNKIIFELGKYKDDFEVITNFLISLMNYLKYINATEF